MLDQIESDVFSAIRDRLGIATPIDTLIKSASVERDHTGVGRFTTFALTDNASSEFRHAAGKRVVDGPHIENPELERGACSLFFLDAPADCTLEFAAYGDSFPEPLNSYHLLRFPDNA